MSTENFINRCKESGLKVTPQRIAIFQEVLKSKEHPSADAIYRRLKKKHPNLSFDTVNRTLLTFAEIGLIQIVEGSGDVRRFDPTITNHHHLRCRRCGKIMDFYSEEYNNLKVPDEIKNEFEISNIRVIVEGVCKKCKKV